MTRNELQNMTAWLLEIGLDISEVGKIFNGEIISIECDTHFCDIYITDEGIIINQLEKGVRGATWDRQIGWEFEG